MVVTVVVTVVKVETRVGTKYAIALPTREFPADDRRPADQSSGEISQGSSEVVYETLAPVKTVAGIFSQPQVGLKNDSMTSLATSSMTSMTSTETDKGITKATKPILVRKSKVHGTTLG